MRVESNGATTLTGEDEGVEESPTMPIADHVEVGPIHFYGSEAGNNLVSQAGLPRFDDLGRRVSLGAGGRRPDLVDCASRENSCKAP